MIGGEGRYDSMKNQDDKRVYEEPDLMDEENEEPKLELSRQERRWIIMGALKSALLIASVYIIGGALLIWFLLAVWS